MSDDAQNDGLMRCPKCGSQECVSEWFEGSVDRETGYDNSGHMGTCLRCGCRADVEDFEP